MGALFSLISSRGNIKSVWRLVVGLIGLNLIAILVGLLSQQENRSARQQQAKSSVENLAFSLEKEIDDTFDKIDIILQVIADGYAYPLPGASNWEAEIAKQRGRLPVLSSLLVADPAGRIVQGLGKSPGVQIGISDRDYFIRLRDDPKAGIVISQPLLDRVTQKWSLILARRISAADGSFAGVVLGVLPLEHFQRLFASLKLGPKGSIGFRDGQLRLIVRHPAFIGGGEIGATKIGDDFKVALKADATKGTYTAAATSIDGVRRLHSFRHNQTYGYYINVGFANDDFLAEWRSYALGNTVLVGLFFICSIFLGWTVGRSWRQEQAIIEKLRLSEKKYQVLFENAGDAINIHTLNGRILEANQAFCQMLDYGREELLHLNMKDLVAPKQRGYFEERKANLMQKGSHLFESVYLRRDGREIPAEVSLQLAELDDQPVALFICRDITLRKQIEARLHTYNEELQTSRAELRALTGRQHLVREEERTRIAREIHDVLAQELTRLKIDLSWVQRRLAKPMPENGPGPLLEKIQGMLEITDLTISSVQKIATELRPVVLDSLGLAAAVEWQAREFESRTGITCQVFVPGGELNLIREHATGFFRIFQESLTNIARHAQATQVNIRLTCETRIPGDPAGAPPRGALLLLVEDNGRGVAPADCANPHSLGLIGMRERSLLFNGHFEITGAPGKGTAVRVWMPLPPDAYFEDASETEDL
jgi:PAS domain S-box-containing protein